MEFLQTITGGQVWIVPTVFIIVVAAAIVQAGLGMGFGLTAAPLLALLDPHLVPAPTLVIGLVTAASTAWKERQDIVWREVGTGITGRFLGVVAGTLILALLVDRKAFELVFGLMVTLAVALSLGGWRLGFSRIKLMAMGVVSGVMGTITSVGAPPLALIYQDHDPIRARPTLAAFFAMGCGLSLAGLAVSGWMHRHDLWLALTMGPPTILGMFVASRLKGRFDRSYRPVLLSIAGLAGLILIARGLS